MRDATRRILMTFIITGLVCAGGVQAAILGFSVQLDGSQAGTDSPAVGSGIVTLDTVSGELTWDIAFEGLVDGPDSAQKSYFHSAAAGEDGAILDPPGDVSGTGRVRTSPFVGAGKIASEDTDAFLAGNVYVLIPTSAFPEGEIRGQLVQDVLTLPAQRDNTIYGHAQTRSNGRGAYLFAGTPLGRDPKRALIRFNLAESGIPADAKITDAELVLYMSRTEAGPFDVSLHRLLANWGEGASNAPENEGSGAPATNDDATWQHAFYSDVLWDQPGGDFEPTPSATQIVAGSRVSYRWRSDAMAQDIQLWLDDPGSNFGWILIGDETRQGTSKRFNSRHNDDNPPYLMVRYTTEVDGCPYKILGDLNDDCRVDFLDFALMAQNWLVDCLVDPSHPACVEIPR